MSSYIIRDNKVVFNCICCQNKESVELQRYEKEDATINNYQHICSNCKRVYFVKLEYASSRVMARMVWFS